MNLLKSEALHNFWYVCWLFVLRFGGLLLTI